jgi:hypothetical protein
MKSDELEAFYGRYFDSGSKIRAESLEAMGYRLTARFVNVGHKYKLFELLTNRSDQPPDVCFLTENVKQRGVIIPDFFHEHKLKLLSANQVKDKVLNAHPFFKQKVKPDTDEKQRKEPGSALTENGGNSTALDGGAIDGHGLRAHG